MYVPPRSHARPPQAVPQSFPKPGPPLRRREATSVDGAKARMAWLTRAGMPFRLCCILDSC
eukprot:940398-Karenia_brevis.AAC.1